MMIVTYNQRVKIARALGQWTTDSITFAIAYVMSHESHLHHTLVLFCLWTFWAVIKRSYTGRYPYWMQLYSLLKWSLGITLLSLISSLSVKDLDAIGPTLEFGVYLMVLIPLGRWACRKLLISAGFWNKPAVIFGGGTNAKQTILALKSEPGIGYEIKAFALRLPDECDLAVGIQLIRWPESDSDFAALREFHCIIALEAQQSDLRDHLIRQFSQYEFTDVSVVPSMRGVPLFGLETTNFFSHEVLMINLRNSLKSRTHQWTKRFFDVVCASILILLLSPLMLWVAYKIWRSDGAPVIFSQPRVGRGLKTFKFYKFRSMVKNAEDLLKHWETTNSLEWQKYTANNFKLANDPRLISIGELIRRTSIDELPQLFNVLSGDMSLVGPRPLLPREQADYGDDLSLYALTPPGLTGLWQVSGRSETSFEDRVAFDAWYVKNWSLWTDITILFKTWSVVFKRSGAF